MTTKLNSYAEIIKRNTEICDKIRRLLAAELVKQNKCCLSCENFISETQLCKLNGRMPPPRIAVNGCECYDEMIPF